MTIPEPMLIEAYQEDDESIFQSTPPSAWERFRDILLKREPRASTRSSTTEIPF